MLFVAGKNQVLLKIKSLIIFEMVSLKWRKSLTNFLAGSKFIPKLNLKQPGLTYSVSGPFKQHRQRPQTFGETWNLKHLYRNESDKTWLAHDEAYSDSKDLAERNISEKVLKIRAY